MVEDNRGDARLVGHMLAQPGPSRFEITHVENIGDALVRLATERFDAILLDLSLPDAHGLEGLGPIGHAAPDVPIVVLSGSAEETTAIRAVQNGAQDYLVKGQAEGPQLARSIRYAIQRKKAEQQINYRAYHDGLTSLPNRTVLLDRLGLALSRSRRNKLMLALLFLDLDHFKHVNDTLGHDVGDMLLIAVAERLKRCMRESDTVARIGGDEFALVLPEIARPEDVGPFADKVLRALKTPFWLGGHELCISASMGIGLFPSDAKEARALLKCSDVAMYRAKHQGGNAHRFCSPALDTQASEHLVFLTGLRSALERQELTLHYQPIIDLRGRRVLGFEALLRWQHPKLGLVPPLKFIPMAEQAGLIHPIGEWVLDQAWGQAHSWRRAGFRSLSMAVNLSSQQLNHAGFPEIVARVLKQQGGDPSLLELELPESGIMQDPEPAIRMLEKLNATGARVSVDNFGTGYTSLSRLRRFPVDRLKIDRSFVRECAGGSREASIIPSLITMAHALRLEVTAGGVESSAQAAFLRRHRCDRAQGVYFSRPLPADEATSLLRQGPSWSR